MDDKDWSNFADAEFAPASPGLKGNYMVVFRSNNVLKLSRPGIPPTAPVELAAVNVATIPEIKVVKFQSNNMCIKEVTQEMLEAAAIDLVKAAI